TSSPASDLAVLGFSGSSITTPNALASSFTATDTISVNTSTGPVTIAFSNTGSPTNTATTKYLNLATANIGNLLSTIDTITGNTSASTASSVSSTGAVTLDTGTVNDLSISTS